MSDDRSWQPADPDAGAGSGADGRADGYQGRRGRGEQSPPNPGLGPRNQPPRYGERPPPPARPAPPGRGYGPPADPNPPRRDRGYGSADPFGAYPSAAPDAGAAPRGSRGRASAEPEYNGSGRAGERGGDPRLDRATNPGAGLGLGLDDQDAPPPVRSRGGGKAGPYGTKKKASRRRTIIKWSAIGISTVLVLVLGAGTYLYETTIGDIKHTALLPGGVTQAALPADPFGNTAMNILLIGSDTRDSAEDAALGGDSGSGANADAEIILHVSADRTNATVMSIPRDTVTTVPLCTTDKSGNVTVTGSTQAEINSALQDGPECQVAADHDLTGITITGYIMFDFSGVVNMSNAIGGVPVCVTAAVHDTNSGLVLPAGDSTVQGDKALEFLRTRDSFFDGSDLGREETTHYFFSQMIQSLRGKLNFSNVGTLYEIGKALASSTTVSDNYSGVGNLEGLVESLDKIPTDTITFVTMPWEYDPTNPDRVIEETTAANQMFRNIQNDVSYTKDSSDAASASPSPSATVPQAPASVDKASVAVGVYNADGVNGRAGTVSKALVAAGFSDAASAGDSSSAATTDVFYPSGESAQADAVAAALKIPAAQVQESGTYSKVSVVVGTDFESGTTYTVVVTAGNTSGAASAPAESFEQNAQTKGECIPVGSGTLKMAYQ